MSYETAVVSSGAVSTREVDYFGDFITGGSVLSAINSMAGDCGWSSSVGIGNIKYTSVPTPGLGSTVSLTVSLALSGVITLTPWCSGNACAAQTTPFDQYVFHINRYFLWMNKYGIMMQPTVNSGNGAGFQLTALYVPPEMRTVAITDASCFWVGYDLQQSSLPLNVGVMVNGVFKTDPWGGRSNDFIPLSFPYIYGAANGGALQTSNGRPIQHVPYVALATVYNTEAKVAGTMCDAFIQLNNSPVGSSATGPDGRIYRQWAGTRNAGPGVTDQQENLFLALSTV